MCGFLVSINKTNHSASLWKKSFESIRHRGPDSSKIKSFNTNSYKIKFGFHRLAIVDHKNRSSDQPFITEKSILVFNGEIYNYIELKNILLNKKIKFKTKSDTEVLVRYLEVFGLSKTLKDLEGMWAFVWLLKKEQKVFFSRDRYGEKPIYFYKNKDEFIISSEIKAILKLTNKKFNIDINSANNFLNLGLINYDNKTLFSGIYQVPASHYISLIINKNLNYKINKYHHYKNYLNNDSIEVNSAILKKKLTESLVSRLSNEVKVGFLISGGIDSSINFSIARKFIPKNKLYLFFAPSMDKFNKDNHNVSFLKKFYKVKINEVALPRSSNIFKILNKVVWINDYPLTSVNAINQYLMGVEAKKQNIKILISGQGADELFFGYLKYYSFYLINLLKNKKTIELIKNIFFLIKSNFFAQIKIPNVVRYLNFNFSSKESFLNQKTLNIPKNYKNFKNLRKRSFEDMNQFSVPTLCHTEDRMYMMSGIETRFPYLNINLQKFALSLQDTFKLSYGFTKYILRNAFNDELPKKLIFRNDKEGFDTGKDYFLKKNKIFIRKNILNQNSIILKKKIISIKFLKYFDEYMKSSNSIKKYDLNFIFRVISFEIWLNIFKKYLIIENLDN